MRKRSTLYLHTVLMVCIAFISAFPGHAKDEVKFQLVCQTWSRSSTFEALGEKKEIILNITIPKGPVPGLPVEPEVVVAMHPDFTVTMGATPGCAGLTVTDRKSGKELQRFLWQFTEPPRNLFQGWNQGFTGLIYHRNPTTDSEMQMICLARETKPEGLPNESKVQKRTPSDPGPSAGREPRG